MFFLILLLLAGIVGSFFVKGVDAKTAGLIRLILCIFLVALSVGRCKSSQVASGTELTMDRRWLVGWKLGGVLAADFPDGGQVVVVQMNEISDAIREYNDSEVEGFMNGAGGVTFELTTLRGEGGPGGNPMNVSTDTLKAMLSHASNSVAVVSFVNLPLSRMARIKLPPTYVFDPMGSMYWQKALDAGQIKAAIYPVMPEGKPPPTRVTGNPSERFDEMYKLVIQP